MGKVLLIGGSGLLGTELQRIWKGDIYSPSHSQLDINNVESLLEVKKDTDIIVNCAAVLDNRVIQQETSKAIQTNIIGAAHLACFCLTRKIRYVYISTDYVYPGDRGNYRESDPLQPYNLYAWTKLGGECSARAVENHLIIRTSFGPSKFPYNEAFTDKWASKDYVDVIAPMIMEAVLSPLTGVINIGTERKTLHDYATRRNESVKGVLMADTSHSTPYDTSLNLQKWMDYKKSNSIAKPHTTCRACASEKLTKYLDLGLMPLANNLETTSKAAKEKERFPLQVLMCEDCGLSQLSVVIDPDKMFSYYTYQSGINGGYIEHCAKMAVELNAEYGDFGVKPGAFIVDIAGNDGTLLKTFKKVMSDLDVLNIDPASNLAAIAEANGIPTLVEFWSPEVAAKARKLHGPADLITATNVFAHVDNMRDFLFGAQQLLAHNGILVIECPYIMDFMDKKEFDQVYFEHLSYVSIQPVMRLSAKVGLKLVHVQKEQIHGGTIRMIFANDDSDIRPKYSVLDYLAKEDSEGYYRIAKYKTWAADINRTIKSFGEHILSLKKQGYKIAGFAASAKGNTLLNAARLNTDVIDFIADETPAKVGKYSPGTGIPIVHKQEILKRKPDYIIILSWNFADEIMEKLDKMGFEGFFIIPLPEIKYIPCNV